jgi:hypothetical protein
MVILPSAKSLATPASRFVIDQGERQASEQQIREEGCNAAPQAPSVATNPAHIQTIRGSVEILRFIDGLRRYLVEADFRCGASIEICPFGIRETTCDREHLPWAWRATPGTVQVRKVSAVSDFDSARELLREWAREIVSHSNRLASPNYPCEYCASKWPAHPNFWGNPAAPCVSCVRKYPHLLL